MKIIVGLGNPGAKYLTTRHNCGFIFLDNFVHQLEQKEGIEIKWQAEPKLKAITAKVPYQGKILYLVKPDTFMNLSGEAVKNVLDFFKEPLENLIVIYDDIDLPLGEIRIRDKGSAGTHNGMKSIIQTLGSENFLRIRLGIESRGEIAPKLQDLSSFVLSNFTDHEIPYLKKAVEEGIEELKSRI